MGVPSLVLVRLVYIAVACRGVEIEFQRELASPVFR